MAEALVEPGRPARKPAIRQADQQNLCRIGIQPRAQPRHLDSDVGTADVDRTVRGIDQFSLPQSGRDPDEGDVLHLFQQVKHHVGHGRIALAAKVLKIAARDGQRLTEDVRLGVERLKEAQGSN